MGVISNPPQNESKRSRSDVYSADADTDSDDDVIEGPAKWHKDNLNLFAEGNPFEIHGPELPEHLKRGNRNYLNQ